MNRIQMDLPSEPTLSDAQVRELIGRGQQGDMEARNYLVERNLRLVKSIVRRFQGRGFELDDLFQVGTIGLVKAIDQFDLSYDVKFSTYAVPKIIGEIKRHMRESASLHVSRSLKELAAKAMLVRDRLQTESGTTPTINAIACELGVEREDLVAAFEATSPVRSLQEVVHEDDGEPIYLEDSLSVNDEDIPFFVRDILDQLDPDERRLVMLRYFAEKSQMEVAATLGISQAQVSRLERRILGEMRRGM